MIKNKKILFISPHPDDIEFYCGGTIFRLQENNNIIYVRTFSNCKESVPEGLHIDTLQQEYIKAMKTATIEDYFMYNFPVRYFDTYRQNILEEMVKLKKEINPDIVFLPSKLDTHQDHAVIHNEGLRAFKDKSLVSYEVPLNSFDSSFNLIMPLEQRHVNKKLELIACYKSQEFRFYSKPEYILSLLRMAGSYMQQEFAETFKIIKWIG